MEKPLPLEVNDSQKLRSIFEESFGTTILDADFNTMKQVTITFVSTDSCGACFVNLSSNLYAGKYLKSYRNFLAFMLYACRRPGGKCIFYSTFVKDSETTIPVKQWFLKAAHSISNAGPNPNHSPYNELIAVVVTKNSIIEAVKKYNEELSQTAAEKEQENIDVPTKDTITPPKPQRVKRNTATVPQKIGDPIGINDVAKKRGALYS